MDTNDKARTLQREYLREWRKKNPEKVKKYSRNYWEKKAKEAMEADHEHDES